MPRILCVLVVLASFTARSAHAQSDGLPPGTLYWGAHWERGGTIGSRVAWHDFDAGYVYMDPSLLFLWIAGVAGLEKPTGPMHKQTRYFSIRGGGGPLLATLSPTTRLTLDIGLDLEEVQVEVTDEYGTKEPVTAAVLPTYAGPALMQAWFGGRLVTIFIPTVAAAFPAKVDDSPDPRVNGPKVPARWEGDLFFTYYIRPLFVFYGDVGLGWFPKGIYESKEPFLSPRLALGFAI
jgi:hypothetical protein